MYYRFFKIFFVFMILWLGSCGIFFPRKNEPIAKVCFFDPNLKSIIYKNKNNDGIKRIEIELLTSKKDTTSIYLNKVYTVPLKKVDLSLMDTVLLMKNILQIKIWDKSPIIEDYSLMIKPSDWQQKKVIYCRYSTR